MDELRIENANLETKFKLFNQLANFTDLKSNNDIS